MATPTAVDRRHASRRIAAACLSGFLGVGSGACLAAESPQVTPAIPRASESPQVTSAITLRSTLTDNVNLAPSDRRQSDLVIEVAPSVRVNTDTARLKLRLFYQLDGLIDSRESSRSEIRNQLDATGTVQAIENFLFVDLRGNVQQVAISPFGARPPSNANFTDNRTESRTFLISPYVRGRIMNVADYTLRYSETFSRSGAGVDDSRVHEFSGRVSSDASFSWLQWAVEVLDQRIDFQQGRDTTSDRVRGVLTYNIDPQFRVLASAGAERNDFVTLDKKTETTYGGGFEWAPSQRTDVFANWEHRFFGSRWDYGLRHRTPGLSLSLVDSRDITTDAQRLGTAGSAVAYDLLFNALATRIPDPAQRAIETQRLLQQGGIPADLNLPTDFLTSGIFVSRNQQASVALLGARNTAALTLYRLMRTQLEGSAGTPAGLADGRSTVTERGASLALSHRLTPLSSVTALTTWRRTTGNASSEQGTRQWDARLLYTTQFGRKTSGTVEFRHVRADSDFGAASDYRENALIVSLLVQF